MGDAAGQRVHLRQATREAIKQLLAKLTVRHACGVCGAFYTPLNEWGKRSCSLHTMDPHGSAVRGRELFMHGSSSKTRMEHYRCCGTSIDHPFQRDLKHERFWRGEGCTPSDHNSSDPWKMLLTHEETEHMVYFDSNIAMPNNASPYARAWLDIYPLHFLNIAYRYRTGQVPGDTASMVTALLGDNHLLFENPHQLIVEPVAWRRLKSIRAGNRVFSFDVREAYSHMCREFALPMMTLQHQHIQIDVDPAAAAHQDDAHSQSALSRAFAAVGIKPRLNPSASSSSSSSSIPSSGESASTGAGAYKNLYTQLFGQVSSNKQNQSRFSRNDLYSTDADEVIQTMIHSSGRTPTNTIHSGAHVDFVADRFVLETEHYYQTPAPAIPFVVAAWMDRHPKQHDIPVFDMCDISTDMLTYPPVRYDKH